MNIEIKPMVKIMFMFNKTAENPLETFVSEGFSHVLSKKIDF